MIPQVPLPTTPVPLKNRILLVLATIATVAGVGLLAWYLLFRKPKAGSTEDIIRKTADVAAAATRPPGGQSDLDRMTCAQLEDFYNSHHTADPTYLRVVVGVAVKKGCPWASDHVRGV